MQTKYHAGKLETEHVEMQIALSAHHIMVFQLAIMFEQVKCS